MIREALFSHRLGICCRCGKEEYTWDELHSRSAKIAAFLLERGESTALIYGPKCFDYVCCIAGCLMAGVAYIAVTEQTPQARISMMLEQSGTRMILTIGKEYDRDTFPGGAILVQAAQVADTYRELEKLPYFHAEDTAYILFTSGSTGVPKGVRVTYGNLENFLRWFCAIPAIAGTVPETVLNQAEFSFDLSVADLYYTFSRGGCLVLPTCGGKAGSGDAMAELFDSGAELAVMTPSHAELCLLDDRFSVEHLPKLSCIFFCGEVLRPVTVRRLLQRFPHIRILNAYGPTEATCAVCAAEITPELAAGETLPIGMTTGGAVEITLLNENRNAVPQGEFGRILLTGRSVAAGYLGGEEGFSALGEERNFLTGDLGCFHDGFLWYEGRIDDQLKYKGYRLEPGEIECALCAIHGVLQAVVLPRRHPDGRVTGLTAHLVCGKALTEEQIRAELQKRLPDYMIPRCFCLHESLPVTANGKIDRKKVAQC